MFLSFGVLCLGGTMMFFRIFIFQRASNSYNQSVFMQSQAIFITIITLSLLAAANTQAISTTCFSGEYYSSTTGKCQQCDISCAECTTSDGCSLCYDQMYLTPVGNKVLCGYCYDIVAGCTVCSSAYKCARCSNGFYLLSNSTCTNCSTLTPNCALCYQNANTSELYCTACTDPLVLVQGTCVANATASQIQASRRAIVNGASAGSNVQVNLTSSSKSNTSQTQQQNTQTQVQNQATINQTATSSIQSINCDINFVQVGSACTRVIPFCIRYETTTLKCDVCVASYSKSVQGYCIPDILLLSIQNNLQNVQPNPAAQISTNTQNNSYAQTLSNTDSLSCPDGQYLWFGACVIPGTECTNRDANNKCTNCIRGYTLRNGLCIQQILPASATAADTKAGIDSSNNNKNGGLSDEYNGSSTDMSTSNQMTEVLTFGCTLPCLSCRREDLKFCLTCVPGMTIVDALPGICYNQN